MKITNLLVLASLCAVGSLPMARMLAAEEDGRGAVFTMTNAAEDNQIVAFERQGDGSLLRAGTYSTGGNGSGGTTDPLHSQGSLSLSRDHRFLFAVNAGSGTVSSFAVDGTTLTLIGTASSGGSSPTAIAQSDDLLYVLNSGGNGNVSGLRVDEVGRLHPIHNSARSLSDTVTSPTSLAFSPDRRLLVVTESGTNKIDVFRVLEDGTLSNITVNPSSGATPFAPLFTPDGALIVGNASNSISSYQILPNLTLHVISASLPTMGMATCWDVIVARGNAIYTSNAGSSSLSGFWIGRGGALFPIGATVVGTNPAGSTNIDIAADGHGRFLYTLNTAAGAIGIFGVERDGGLKNLGEVSGLDMATGMNGIAAY